MNIFHPYDVLTDTNECLHLKESESHERFHFITHKVLPIALIMAVWLILQQAGNIIPMGWNYVLVAVTLLVAGLLLFRSYVTEIKIIAFKEIFMVQKTITGSKEIIIKVQDINNVLLQKKKRKVKMLFFVLNTNDGKSYRMLSIPSSRLNDNDIKQVKERLQAILRVTVTV